jgi:hypothetical protein
LHNRRFLAGAERLRSRGDEHGESNASSKINSKLRHCVKHLLPTLRHRRICAADFQHESGYSVPCTALQGFRFLLFSNCRWDTGGPQ